MSHEAELDNDLISLFDVLDFMRRISPPKRPTRPNDDRLKDRGRI